MIQCFTFLFIIGISQLNAVPYADKTANYYNDDYNYSSDDDYPNGDDGNGVYGENEDKMIHVTPLITSEPLELIINEGSTIKLPCLVDRIEGFVQIWMKGKDGKDQIAILQSKRPDIMLKKDKRITLKKTEGKGSTLIIYNAEPKDAGNYICKISASKTVEVEHKVRIRVAPEVRSDPANGKLVVMEGESASLGCNVIKGSPTPEIKWRRKERKMPSGDRELRGLRLTFPQVTRHESGVYTCSADNGFLPLPDSAHKTITLDVHHKPVIEMGETFIHTSETDEIEVVCIVHASPRAKIEWLKNGEKIKEDEGIISPPIRNRHTLLLTNQYFTGDKSTFGLYTCRANNTYGSDEKTTEVSGNAGPPNFKSDQEGKQESNYSLEWVVESITDVTAFKIEYREDDGSKPWEMKPRMQKAYYTYTTESEISNSIEDSSEKEDEINGKIWKTVADVGSPIPNGENMYTGRYVFTKLSPRTNYIVRVSSKNAYGFSNPSPSSYFKFGTKGAVSLPFGTPSSSNRNQDMYLSVTLILSLMFITSFSQSFQSAFNSRSFLHCV